MAHQSETPKPQTRSTPGLSAGYLVIGVSHETAEFAVAAIRRWWVEVGQVECAGHTRLLIQAGGGGANRYDNWLWKASLQCNKLSVQFNPLDVPRDQFIVGGKAWRLCRTGQVDPEAFGIFDMRGLWFVRGSIRSRWAWRRMDGSTVSGLDLTSRAARLGFSRREGNMPKDTASIKWLSEPEEHDYPAALSYLSLIYPETAANACIEKLRRAAVVSFKAKDIFRASTLSLLGVSNSHVEKDRQKVEAGQALSPLLLVRDSAQGKVIIADGYHRLCAVYAIDEDALIPCKIV